MCFYWCHRNWNWKKLLEKHWSGAGERANKKQLKKKKKERKEIWLNTQRTLSGSPSGFSSCWFRETNGKCGLVQQHNSELLLCNTTEVQLVYVYSTAKQTKVVLIKINKLLPPSYFVLHATAGHSKRSWLASCAVWGVQPVACSCLSNSSLWPHLLVSLLSAIFQLIHRQNSQKMTIHQTTIFTA